MTNSAARLREAHALLEKLLQGEIADDEAVRLEQLVVADAACRRLYVRAFRLYSTLPHLLLEDDSANDSSSAAIASEDAAIERSEPRFYPANLAVWFAKRPRRSSWMVAALVMALLFTAMAYMAAPIYRSLGRNSGETSPSVVALLSGTRDARWVAGRERELGALLPAGQRLKLTAGMAEITFLDGATVVLEGECDFEVRERGRGRLERGSLVARVSERARGFTIDTPAACVVDLGTEFGVSVNDSGASEIVVFAGVVDVMGGPQYADRRRQLRLTQGQAAVVAKSAAPQRSTANTRTIAAHQRRLDTKFGPTFAVEETTGIGLNFVDARLKTPCALTPHTPAGVVPQLHWNNTVANTIGDGGIRGRNADIVSPILGAIVDSHGEPTNVKVSWEGYTTWSNAGQPRAAGNRLLLTNFLLTEASLGPDATVTLENVPYAHYDVYVYFTGGSSGNRPATITLNGKVQREVTSLPLEDGALHEARGAAESGHYVRFASVRGPTVTVSLDALGGGFHMGICGVQVVDASDTLPEDRKRDEGN